MNVRQPTREIQIFLASVGAIAALTASLRTFANVSPTTAALALLLVVLGAATLARLRIAIVVSVVAMLALNFYFLPPLGTLHIADPQNWIALFAFLVVAVIASNLSAAAEHRARDAVARRHEVTRLFDLTCDVLLTSETARAVEILARHVARRFELARIAICLPGDDGWRIYQGGVEELAIEPATLNSAFTQAPGEQPGVGLVPLRHGTRVVGLLAIASSSLDTGALDAVAGVVAIAIERTQFLVERDATALVRQKADLAASLLASLSHDLRTPLTAVRVAVENLRGDLSPGERRVQTDAAMTELERLTRLVSDILDMARIDAEAIRIERQWVTPSDIVDAALAHVRHAVDGHAIRVDADADAEVEIDPRLTSVALSHVVENAAHYSPREAPIVVRAEARGDGLHVTVTDGGPGLAPGELEHLFERFYRGRSARQRAMGTGMGLAITRGLLSAAGGRIWAENASGSGARFSLVVPGAVRPVPVAS